MEETLQQYPNSSRKMVIMHMEQEKYFMVGHLAIGMIVLILGVYAPIIHMWITMKSCMMVNIRGKLSLKSRLLKNHASILQMPIGLLNRCVMLFKTRNHLISLDLEYLSLIYHFSSLRGF